MRKIIKILSVTAGVLIVALVWGLIRYIPSDIKDAYLSSVTITNAEENQGGSGVIIKSFPMNSYILTNAHVCRVIGSNGIVKTLGQSKFTISTMAFSIVHDLCLITVFSDLGISVNVAKTTVPRGTKVTVVGHPLLLPTVVTHGEFSGRIIIRIMGSTPKCPFPGLFCSGKLENYEADVMTATIQTGSSGSGVFNSKGELVALVFAGSGTFGYALTVPLEYIHEFIITELNMPYLLGN
jgi:S1-C subfamily serine protease